MTSAYANLELSTLSSRSNPSHAAPADLWRRRSPSFSECRIHSHETLTLRIPIRCAPIGYNIATLRVNVSRFSIMYIGDFAFLPLDQTMTMSATRQLIGQRQWHQNRYCRRMTPFSSPGGNTLPIPPRRSRSQPAGSRVGFPQRATVVSLGRMSDRPDVTRHGEGKL